MITSRSGIVWLLTGLNLLNYLDRYIITAVSPKLQEELSLSDFQTGAVLSAFMLGYFVTSPVFGAMGDRYARRGLISVGVALWSIATVVSGFARGFVSLTAARIAVGVGEASYATLAPTIIDDVSDAASKNKWLSIFYTAIPVGSALGFVIGGVIEHELGWRAAFFVAGAPGILLAGLVLLMREPERTGKQPAKADPVDAVKALVRVPLYVGSVAGYTAYTFALGAFAAWAPKYLHKVLGMELRAADFWLGALLAGSGFVGTIVGGSLGDRAAKSAGDDASGRTRAYLRVCAIVTGLAAPPALICLLTGTPVGFFIAFGLTCVLLFTATAPVNAALLQSAPVERRASAMALSIFAIHLFGDLPSPPLVGLVSDSWREMTHPGLVPGADGLPPGMGSFTSWIATDIAEAASLRFAMFFLPAFVALGAVLWGLYGWRKAPAKAA